MTVNLTPHAAELLEREISLGTGRSPEEVVERALETLPYARALEGTVPLSDQPRDPAGAVDRIRKLRKGLSLGGITVKDLVNEGRKY